MASETFTSPVLQAAHEITLGWRLEYKWAFDSEAIFIEDSFSEQELLTLARAVIAAHEAKDKSCKDTPTKTR